MSAMLMQGRYQYCWAAQKQENVGHNSWVKKLFDMNEGFFYRKILNCKNIEYDRNLGFYLEKVKINC